MAMAECEDWSLAYKNTQKELESFRHHVKVQDLIVKRSGTEEMDFTFIYSAKIDIQFPAMGGQPAEVVTHPHLGVVEVLSDCSVSLVEGGTAGVY